MEKRELATDGHRFFKARQGWHICSIAIPKRAMLRRRDISGNADRISRPDGAEILIGLWCYKYVPPTALGFGGEYMKPFLADARRKQKQEAVITNLSLPKEKRPFPPRPVYSQFMRIFQCTKNSTQLFWVAFI